MSKQLEPSHEEEHPIFMELFGKHLKLEIVEKGYRITELFHPEPLGIDDWKEKFEALKKVYDAFTNPDTASVDGIYKLTTEILEGRKRIKELEQALSEIREEKWKLFPSKDLPNEDCFIQVWRDGYDAPRTMYFSWVNDAVENGGGWYLSELDGGEVKDTPLIKDEDVFPTHWMLPTFPHHKRKRVKE